MYAYKQLLEHLKQSGRLKQIKIYPAYLRTEDPYEKNKEVNYLNPITIEGYVVDEGFSSLKFKYFGELPYGSKKLICDTKYLSLLKTGSRIEIDNEIYGVYFDADKNFAIINREDYLVVILMRKADGI